VLRGGEGDGRLLRAGQGLEAEAIGTSASESTGRLKGADGFELFYRRWAVPDPKKVVVGYHGIGLHSEYLAPIGRGLASKGCAFYGVDLRGFGNSKEPDLLIGDTKSYPKTLEDIDEVMKQVKALHPGKEVFMLGHSLGASFALWYGSHHPDGVDGFVLLAPAIVSTTALTQMDKLIYFFALLLSPARQFSYSTLWIPEVRKDSEFGDQTADPLVAKGLSVRWLEGIRTSILLNKGIANGKGVTKPVLLLWGDKDNVNLPKGAEMLMGALASKDKTLEWMEGANHFFYGMIGRSPGSRYDPAMQARLVGVIADWLAKH